MKCSYLDLHGTHLLLLLHDFALGVINSRQPNEIIRRGTPYMERWMIGRKMAVPTFVASRSRLDEECRADDQTPMPTEVENAFLHRFLRNDAESQHCHPWWNFSLVLRGRYVEEVAGGDRFERRPGGWVWRDAHDRHAIVEVEPGTISLFVTGPKEREWGFWPDGDTFVHHTEWTAWRHANGLLPEGS